MKATRKEILNNKAVNMIDLILDEIGTNGAKTISSSFTDKRDNITYKLELQLTAGAAEDVNTAEEINSLESLIADVVTNMRNLTSIVDTLSTRVSALEAKHVDNEEPTEGDS